MVVCGLDERLFTCKQIITQRSWSRRPCRRQAHLLNQRRRARASPSPTNPMDAITAMRVIAEGAQAHGIN